MTPSELYDAVKDLTRDVWPLAVKYTPDVNQWWLCHHDIDAVDAASLFTARLVVELAKLAVSIQVTPQSSGDWMISSCEEYWIKPTLLQALVAAYKAMG